MRACSLPFPLPLPTGACCSAAAYQGARYGGPEIVLPLCGGGPIFPNRWPDRSEFSSPGPAASSALAATGRGPPCSYGA